LVNDGSVLGDGIENYSFPLESPSPFGRFEVLLIIERIVEGMVPSQPFHSKLQQGALCETYVVGKFLKGLNIRIDK
jgi:hypothetical protein